jgi:transcriptional regulator with XRE-family HTH domain
MLIGERIRAIREGKNLSQGDMEKRSGLLRVYVSRIENGHTVPSIETVEKLTRALGVPLYQLFYVREKRCEINLLLERTTAHQAEWGTTRKEAHFWKRLRRLLSRYGDRARAHSRTEACDGKKNEAA